MSHTPLDLVEGVCRRYVLYPSEHAVVAHVLWIAHTHMMERWDTTPRIAFMSAEKESGKTRALEVTSLLVPTPIMSISASPAAIVRLITATTPTLLCDEIDAIFGSKKAEESNVDLRSVLNAGYRRGAYYYRCVAKGKEQVPEAMQCYAAAALAGLKTLPDTLASRAIFIHMRRRAPDEKLTPYRTRYAEAEAKPIR